MQLRNNLLASQVSYKVATTAWMCWLATVAWLVNINLLLLVSSWWKPSSTDFSSRDQARATDC